MLLLLKKKFEKKFLLIYDKFFFIFFLILLRKYKINIVYNKIVKLSKKDREKFLNILYISESPEYAKKHGWYKFDHQYDIEFSCRKKSRAKFHKNITDIYSLCDIYGNSQANLSEIKYRKGVLLSSSKNHLSGHKIRNEITNLVLSGKEENIDIYGDIVKKPYKNSSQVYSKYFFSIVVENTLDGEYISEKLFDAIKAKRIIFYYGNKKIVKQYKFNTKSIIFFNDSNDLLSKIKKIYKLKSYSDINHAIEYNFSNLEFMRHELLQNFLKNITLPLLLRQNRFKSAKNAYLNTIYKK